MKIHRQADLDVLGAVDAVQPQSKGMDPLRSAAKKTSAVFRSPRSGAAGRRPPGNRRGQTRRCRGRGLAGLVMNKGARRRVVFQISKISSVVCPGKWSACREVLVWGAGEGLEEVVVFPAVDPVALRDTDQGESPAQSVAAEWTTKRAPQCAVCKPIGQQNIGLPMGPALQMNSER